MMHKRFHWENFQASCYISFVNSLKSSQCRKLRMCIWIVITLYTRVLLPRSWNNLCSDRCRQYTDGDDIKNNCCWFFSQYVDIAAREVQVREDGNAFPEYVVVIIFPQMLIETLEINWDYIITMSSSWLFKAIVYYNADSMVEIAVR